MLKKITFLIIFILFLVTRAAISSDNPPPDPCPCKSTEPCCPQSNCCKQDRALIDQEISDLEDKVNHLDSDIDRNVETLKSVSERVFDSFESNMKVIETNMNFLTILLSAIGGVLALLGFALGFFGFKSIDDINKFKSRTKKALIKSEIEHKNMINNTVGWGRLKIIQDLIESEAYSQALNTVKDIIKTQPTDKFLSSAAYGWKGYILKRIDEGNRISEAFGAIEKAIEIDPKNIINTFNAACYAALQEDFDNVKMYINETMDLDPKDGKQLIDEELKDGKKGDFRYYLTNPGFKILMNSYGIKIPPEPKE